MANNYDLYAEYEWNFHFRNLTVELYSLKALFHSMMGNFTHQARYNILHIVNCIYIIKSAICKNQSGKH